MSEELRNKVEMDENSETDTHAMDEHGMMHALGIEHTHSHNHDYDDGYAKALEEEHAMMHELGIAHGHDHSHSHGNGHGHTHSHEHTKAVLNRLSRAIGHLQSVRRMVEDGRDCSEVLIQIAAVRNAIDNTGKLILQDHLKHCIIDAATEGDIQAIEDLCRAVDKYM